MLGNPLASADHTKSIYSENLILKSSEKKLKKSSVIFEKYLKSICSFQHAKQLSVKYFSKKLLNINKIFPHVRSSVYYRCEWVNPYSTGCTKEEDFLVKSR